MAFLSIMARLGMDGTGFRAGIKQAESATAGLSRNLNSNLKGAIAGAFGTAAIAAAMKATVDYAGQITDLSVRLGVSTDALQEFDYAARLTGTNLETFTGFMEKLAEARDKALEGNEDTIASFRELGVSLDDLRTKRLEDLTRQIGRAVQGGDAQRLISPLRDVGGRGAGALIPAFNAGLDEMGAQARRAGAIISPEDIAALDDASDKFDALTMRLKAGLAPALTFLMEIVQRMVDYFGIIGETLDYTLGGIARSIGRIAGGESPISAFKAEFVDGFSTMLDRIGARIDAFERRQIARPAQPILPGGNPNAEAAARARVEERVTKLREQIADKEFKLLPAAAQRAALLERVARLRRESASADAQFDELGDRGSEAEALEARGKLLDAEAQLKAFGKSADKGSDPMVNALERIGFSFGKTDAVKPEVRRLESIDNRLRDHGLKLGAISDATARTAGAIT